MGASMHLKEILDKEKTTFSFEFFPPKDDRTSEHLFVTISNLIALKPSYVSVTYGAGGSTRELTHDLVIRLQNETDLTVVSHLTCIGSSRDEIYKILEKYSERGIQNIMALRGDQPKVPAPIFSGSKGFQYASELVSFIKKNFPALSLGVAGYPEGHPETPNRLNEIDNLKKKVDSGADYICTQLFFNNRDFYDFCERCEIAGIHVPILAGIMPITSRQNLIRMADLASGMRYPARLLRALQRAENDEDFEKIGIHWAAEQVLDLLDNKVRGIHFYTLNQSKATLKIYDSLGLKRAK
jgi:methylenetetrahydrofolate reductase (NADPH)